MLSISSSPSLKRLALGLLPAASAVCSQHWSLQQLQHCLLLCRCSSRTCMPDLTICRAPKRSQLWPAVAGHSRSSKAKLRCTPARTLFGLLSAVVIDLQGARLLTVEACVAHLLSRWPVCCITGDEVGNVAPPTAKQLLRSGMNKRSLANDCRAMHDCLD